VLVMAALFQRLDEEEAIVRGELEALREKIVAAEERRQLLGEDDPAEGQEAVSSEGWCRKFVMPARICVRAGRDRGSMPHRSIISGPFGHSLAGRRSGASALAEALGHPRS
jgi:hypothetical protein